MKISCVLVSHEKPDFVHDAIASVVAQTHPDWELVVIDSGALLASGAFFQWSADPRITVVASGETAEMRRTYCLQGWCCNEAYRRELVRGDLVCYLCDDDVYCPDAFAVFAAAAERDRSARAWYGGLEVWEGDQRVGVATADVAGGPEYSLDLKADALQACCRRKQLQQGAAWPERRQDAWHADGLFLASLCRLGPVCPLPVLIGRHRRTPGSTYTRPGSGGLWVELGGGPRPLGKPWLNVDVCEGADVHVDLSRDPLPFPDDWVGRVYSSHCFEHIEPYNLLLHEIVRTCRVGASVELRVPHHLSEMAHCAGHRHALTPVQVRHWCQDFVPDWWAGCRKRLHHTGTEVIPWHPVLDQARVAFPTLTDAQRMQFLPGCVHETRFTFEVIPNE